MEKKIYCCACKKNVMAKLTDGSVTYPHREDLHSLPFWRCQTCKNFVGCHHKTKDRTRPLGNIPTKELKNARQHIHKILDPIWQNGKVKRGVLYSMIAEKMDIKEYHTAELTSVDDARKVYSIVKAISKEYP